MKAVVQDRYGSPEQLELRDVEDPNPGAGEVLVRVRAASLHPDVWHVVCGRPYVLRLMGSGVLRPKNPIPGTDMAGVVEASGPGATRFRAGDPVFGETLPKQQWENGGTFAELVCVNQELLARKPDRVSFEEAASVPTSGIITLSNLRGASEWRPGKRVLIIGAGGGVGSIALQVTKACGAHVTAVDTTNKQEMLVSLGADEAIDYTREDWLDRGQRYDLIFDVPGHRPFSSFKTALTSDGKYVPIGHEGYGALGRDVFGLIPHFLKLMALSRFVKQLGSPGLPPPSKKEAMETLRDLLETGKLTPFIDSVYPFSRVRDAFRHMVEDELHGKVLMVPGESV